MGVGCGGQGARLTWIFMQDNNTVAPFSPENFLPTPLYLHCPVFTALMKRWWIFSLKYWIKFLKQITVDTETKNT